VAAANCTQLNKPMRLAALTRLIQQLLPEPGPPSQQDGTVFVVDDDPGVRTGIAALLAQEGRRVVAFESCEAFIDSYQPGPDQCLLVDANLPGMGGLDLLRHLSDGGQLLSSIMMTGDGDVAMAVEAMKAGAADFIEKPVSGPDLLASIARALAHAHGTAGRQAWEREAAAKIGTLSARQHEIMLMVLEGHPSKNIAADLNISQRTVENHRAAIMHKTGSASLPALARLAVAAARTTPPPDPTLP
jgi:two-component system CheB/CheR fusion protein